MLAKNVTMLPWHDGLLPEIKDTFTVGVTTAFIVIVIPLLTTADELAHVAFELSSQLTTSPLFNADGVKLAAFVPATLPFIIH